MSRKKVVPVHRYWVHYTELSIQECQVPVSEVRYDMYETEEEALKALLTYVKNERAHYELDVQDLSKELKEAEEKVLKLKTREKELKKEMKNGKS